VAHWLTQLVAPLADAPSREHAEGQHQEENAEAENHEGVICVVVGEEMTVKLKFVFSLSVQKVKDRDLLGVTEV